jgi:hypothetical protein
VFLLLLLPCTVLEECISVLPRCATWPAHIILPLTFGDLY